MTAPSVNVIPITVAEQSRFDRFRAAMHASRALKAITTDEMIQACLDDRDRVEKSCHRAEEVYGAPFDGREVRMCVVLEAVAILLGIVEQHKDEVGPILRSPAPAQRKRRT